MLSTEYAVTMTEQPSGEPGIADLKAKLSDYVNRVLYRGETIYVTKNRRRVAALVPVEMVELADAVLAGATLEELTKRADRLRDIQS